MSKTNNNAAWSIKPGTENDEVVTYLVDAARISRSRMPISPLVGRFPELKSSMATGDVEMISPVRFRLEPAEGLTWACPNKMKVVLRMATVVMEQRATA